jgi:hypothetical protein
VARSGTCLTCGQHVPRDGHAPDCPKARCRRCGVQTRQLANFARRLCADCADLNPPDDRDDVDGQRGAAVLLCFRPTAAYSCVMTVWESLDQALDAATEFPRCRPECIGDHVIATKVAGRIRTFPATPAITRRDIQLAMTGDHAAITRLRHQLSSQKGSNK